jgi:negative regulator of replication initiation
MKNITVTVDDEIYRRARIRAAEIGTSVSRVVKDGLVSFAAESTGAEARGQRIRAIHAGVMERLKGVPAEPVQRNWREKMYDDRFDETILGRALIERDI